jgi:hypothetical protein
MMFLFLVLVMSRMDILIYILSGILIFSGIYLKQYVGLSSVILGAALG